MSPPVRRKDEYTPLNSDLPENPPSRNKKTSCGLITERFVLGSITLGAIALAVYNLINNEDWWAGGGFGMASGLGAYGFVRTFQGGSDQIKDSTHELKKVSDKIQKVVDKVKKNGINSEVLFESEEAYQAEIDKGLKEIEGWADGQLVANVEMQPVVVEPSKEKDELIGKLRQALKEAKEKWNAAEEEKDRLTLQVAELEGQLTTAEEGKDEALGKLEELDGQLRQKDREIAAYQEANADLQEVIDRMTNSTDDAAKLMEEAKSAKSKVDSINASLKDKTNSFSLSKSSFMENLSPVRQKEGSKDSTLFSPNSDFN